MKQILFLTAIILGLLSSCSSDDEYQLPQNDDLKTRVNFTDPSEPYELLLDIYGDKYKTFLVLPATNVVLGDEDPFPRYWAGEYDEDGREKLEYVSDYAIFAFIHQNSGSLHFSNEGLYPSIYDVSYYGESTLNRIPIGSKITIWASENEYTDLDLYNHYNDPIYYGMMSKTFKCYYITTLKARSMYIICDSGSWWEI